VRTWIRLVRPAGAVAQGRAAALLSNPTMGGARCCTRRLETHDLAPDDWRRTILQLGFLFCASTWSGAFLVRARSSAQVACAEQCRVCPPPLRLPDDGTPRGEAHGPELDKSGECAGWPREAWPFTTRDGHRGTALADRRRWVMTLSGRRESPRESPSCQLGWFLLLLFATLMEPKWNPWFRRRKSSTCKRVRLRASVRTCSIAARLYWSPTACI
jgi:hypothetical protein